MTVALGGRTPVMDTNVAQQMGYRLAIQPVILISTLVVGARLRTQSAHQIMTAAKATDDAKLRDNLS
jgi:hypothetical protein